jgi:replicative DNA helicase
MTQIPSRAMPQNLEAERALLGSTLLDNSVLGLASNEISGNDLFSATHCRIFSAAMILSDPG